MPNELKNKFADVISRVDYLTKISDSFSSGKIIAFTPISLILPEFFVPIHGFYTSISWLYVLYFESGKSCVEFLAERAFGLGIDHENIIKKHLNLIDSFRTYLQHNLDLGNQNDITKKYCCHNWIKNCLQLDTDFAWPKGSDDWNILSESLLSEAENILNIMGQALFNISNDKESNDSLDVWLYRIQRNHAPWEFDEIIETVASDFGIKYIDPIVIRNKFFPKWNSKISLMQRGSDFKELARLLVEQTLIFEEELPVPISGKDIMDLFSLGPGQEVKRLKEEAQRLFNEHPCSKEEILVKLKLFYT
jgi:hypothetical protein